MPLVLQPDFYRCRHVVRDVIHHRAAAAAVLFADRWTSSKDEAIEAMSDWKALYSPTGQFIIANNYFRPRNPAVAAKYKGQFPSVPMFTVDKNFGGWAAAQKNHFADGGTFDQVYAAAKR